MTAASRKVFSNADDARGLYSSPLVNSYIKVIEGFAEISQRADVKTKKRRNEESRAEETRAEESRAKGLRKEETEIVIESGTSTRNQH